MNDHDAEVVTAVKRKREVLEIGLLFFTVNAHSPFIRASRISVIDDVSFKKLRRIYSENCNCVVVLQSPDYKERHWTGNVEWRSIEELINMG